MRPFFLHPAGRVSSRALPCAAATRVQQSHKSCWRLLQRHIEPQIRQAEQAPLRDASLGRRLNTIGLLFRTFRLGNLFRYTEW